MEDACYWWGKMPSTGFYRFCESLYLKYPKSLQSERKYELSVSNEMWQHVFRSGFGSYIFTFFQLHNWFIFYFFSYLVIIHLLRRGEFVGIYCKLIPDWIESTWARILFPAQCRAGTQNQILNTNWIIIPIYHGVITLNLFKLFYCDCILSL